ncbi:hypothetical protein [Botryobacter ruber]|uniref:hypothetical protein n=1 Tax=Botryobacter ruber TaxID=2171629 RepID=UPI000E0BE55A|nr:hypothetical protein [Botryobacter ruber]
MNLLYLTFGPYIKNHYQANFSILSFLQHRQEVRSIYVYTDYPAYYQHLGGHVQVVTISEAQLQDWKGPYDFFWRVKIKAIEDLILRQPEEAVVYLDSDTFLHKPVQAFNEQLNQGVAFMHEREGALHQLRSKTDKRMWQQVKGMDFGSFKLSEKHSMWNAGVVAVPASKNKQAIALALELCDTMCREQVTPRLIEQFALSVALDETYGLREAKPWIGHYWGNKDEWNNEISRFFLESLLKNFSLEQDIDRMRSYDFRKIALHKHIKNTRRRLINFIDSIFPPKDKQFVEE